MEFLKVRWREEEKREVGWKNLKRNVLRDSGRSKTRFGISLRHCRRLIEGSADAELYLLPRIAGVPKGRRELADGVHGVCREHCGVGCRNGGQSGHLHCDSAIVPRVGVVAGEMFEGRHGEE